MTKNFYYIKGDQQFGPVDKGQLISEVDNNTLIWYDGLDEWKKISDIPELIEKTKNPPPIPNKLKLTNKGNSNRKNKIIITGSFFFTILLTLLIFYLFTDEYSIADITADNYREKLGSYEEANLGFLQNIIPDPIPLHKLYEANEGNNNGYEIKIEEFEGGHKVDIYSPRTDVVYYLNYKEEKLSLAIIFQKGFAGDASGKSNPYLSQAINKIQELEGFTVKKTNLKTGRDIIISETKSRFTIVEVHENDNGVYSFITNQYSKKRYGKFLKKLQFFQK